MHVALHRLRSCTNQAFGRDNVTNCVYSTYTWMIRSVFNMFINQMCLSNVVFMKTILNYFKLKERQTLMCSSFYLKTPMHLMYMYSTAPFQTVLFQYILCSVSWFHCYIHVIVHTFVFSTVFSHLYFFDFNTTKYDVYR